MGILLPIMVFVEKIVAFIKQIIVASYFGTNEFTDAYQIAENIVSIIRGAFSNSFPIVFLASLVKKKEYEQSTCKEYISESIGTGSLIIAVLSFVSILFFCKYNTGVSFGLSVSSSYYSNLYSFIIILSPTVLLSYLSGMMSSQLEAEKIYWPAKIISLLTSISVICCVALLFNRVNLISIFIGEIIALLLHIILLLFLLKRNNILFIPKVAFFSLEVQNLWKAAFPLMISSSVYSINSLIDKAIAIEITEGSATVLQYARTLTLELFPIIIVTAFSGVLLRNFSERIAREDFDGLTNLILVFMQGMIGFLSVVAIVSFFYSNSIISIAFERGKFNAKSVLLTNEAFMGYIIGIVFFPIREISARVHYAFNDTKITFVSSLVGVSCNIILSFLLAKILGIYGIAIATSISILISGIINFAVLKRKRGIVVKGTVLEWIKILMGIVFVMGVNLLYKYCFDNGQSSIIKVIMIATVSIVIYYFSTYLLKARSTAFVLGMIRK